ncbi:DNA internalization-related competence protein ComEC/Rec2 [Aquabacterium sp. A08]|nr:DNA internalization-related competence protein ComEC/Rec2 [Aquabacterium sp. A08]
MLGAVIGAAWQLQWAELPGWATHSAVAALGLLAAAVAARWRGMAPVAAAALALCAALALAWAATGARALGYAQGALPPALEGRDLVVEGVVAGLPRQGDTGVQFEFDIASARLAGAPVAVPASVRLSWLAAGPPAGSVAGRDGAALPAVRAGERWRLTVRLYRPHGLANPHGFDTELWLWERGLRATGHVRRGRDAPAPALLEHTWRYPVQQARQRVRDRLWAQVDDPRSAGLLVALLAGDQASIGPDDWAVFRTTGIAHLVSVSGVHVTMFAWLAVWTLGLAWRWLGRWRPGLLLAAPTPMVAGVGGVVLAALYAAFSGWGVPSQRTVLMLAAVTALRLSGRRWPWPVVWLLAMNALVWIDPWALLQPGFWLSFVAVGVLFATAWPQAPAPGGSALARQGREMLQTQAVVTVALAPLTLMLFGQFSLIGLVANLFAIPWVTLLVTPLAMLGAVWPLLWTPGAWAVDALLWCLHALAQVPGATLERPALPLGLAMLAALGGVLLVLRLPWAWRGWGLLLLWPALVYAPPRPAHGTFEVVAPDVGQGTAVLVRTARHTLLYDTGPPLGASTNAAERVLLPLLRAGGDRLDAVMVSHADSDHASGAASVARAHPRAVWWASWPLGGPGAEPPLDAVRARPCLAGEHWDWDGVRFEVLHPRPADHAAGLSENARSCVLRIGGDGGALLTGDITLAEETRLALERPELRTQLLLAAHHGSQTSTGPVWLNTLRPAVVVVQAGHRNRYGHPAPVVVRRLQARPLRWVASPRCGAATWRSTEPQRIDCHRDTARRYWHTPRAGAPAANGPDPN